MLFERSLQSTHVRRVQNCCSHTHLGQNSLDELASASVAVCGGDDMTSCWY